MPGKAKVPTSPEALDAYAKTLRGIAGSLGRIAKEIRGLDLPSINAMGQATADLGVNFFDSLIDSCEREIKKVKKERTKAARHVKP